MGWGRQRVAWTERPGEGWEDMSAPASQKAMGRLGCAWQAGHPQATGVPACQPVTSLACKVWSTWNLGCGRQGVEADDPANVNDAVEAMVLRGGVQ